MLDQAQAIEKFFEIRGDEVDQDDIADAVREIGNPDANLPVVKTGETVDDFRRNGWTDYTSEVEGIVVLKKGKRTFVNIADCGDHRLALVETL